MEVFLIKFADESSLEIPLSIAREGSTLRNIIEDLGNSEIQIPSDVDFTKNDVSLFFENYSSFLEGDLDIELDKLLGIITVVDYFGYDEVNGNFLKILVTKFIRGLTNFFQEVYERKFIRNLDSILNKLERIKHRYSTISLTIESLIKEELERSRYPIALGSYNPTLNRDQSFSVQIVTDSQSFYDKIHIVGWVNEFSKNVSHFFSDIPNLEIPKLIKNMPSYHREDNRIVQGLESEIGSLSENGTTLFYHWLTYTDQTLNLHSYVKLGWTSPTLKTVPFTKNPKVDEKRLTHYKSKVFKYHKCLLSWIPRVDGLITANIKPWQMVDEEDRRYYSQNIQCIYLEILNLDNLRVIFSLYTTKNDQHIIDEEGKYLLILRRTTIPDVDDTKLLELYDIEKKVRLFKVTLQENIDSEATLELDVYNECIRFFHINNISNYLVFNFKGEIIHERRDVPISTHKHGISVKGGNLVFISGYCLGVYAPKPDSSFDMEKGEYALFLRDPVTLTLKEKLKVLGGLHLYLAESIISHLNKLCVSPDGKNFTLCNSGTVYYYRMFTGEDEEIKEVLNILRE